MFCSKGVDSLRGKKSIVEVGKKGELIQTGFSRVPPPAFHIQTRG